MATFYFIINYLLTIYLSYSLWTSVTIPLFFKIIFILCFLYFSYVLIEVFVSFFFYIISSPKILEGKELSGNELVVMFRPIFAGSEEEMENVLTSLEEDIKNNAGDFSGQLKSIVIDNSRKDEVKEYTLNRIKELQGKYGEGNVFYFHRNVECDFFKKLGIYEDAIMFLSEGWTRPGHYTDKKWEKWAKGTRNPDKPLWDIISGDISALGIEAEVADILEGKDIKVNPDKTIRAAFVSDADNTWPEGEVKKLTEKIINPDNEVYIIYQPLIKVLPPFKNLYTKICIHYRNLFQFVPTLRWRLFSFSPFYGKGAMQIKGYVEKIIKGEALHPGKAASHDFQETLFADSALVEDVTVLEETFSNKVSELKRVAQWRWGDMETVRQYRGGNFSTGRKKHLSVLLRCLIEPIVISLFIILLSILVLSGNIELTSIYPVKLYVFLWLFGYVFAPMLLAGESNLILLWLDSVITIIFNILLKSLDYIYMPQAVIRNYIRQKRGETFVWKTGAMGEIATRGMNLWSVYGALKNSLITGIIFLFLASFNKIFLVGGIIFILAPFAVWFSCKE